MAYAVAGYIEHQRDKWDGRGSALKEEVRARFSRYFAVEDLDRVRVVENARLPLPNPPGFQAFRRLSGLSLLDPDEVAAITFDHVILARQPVWDSLLFHELVHVTQFRLLGVRRFSKEYVRGFLATRSYEGIPLEACAFELEDRYLRLGGGSLNVELEVRRRFDIR